MQTMQTIQSLGEKVQRQADQLKTQGAEVVTKAQETAQTSGRKLTERLERLRGAVAWDRLTPENLKAAAEDAAHAFAGHFRPAAPATPAVSTAAPVETPASPAATPADVH